MSVLGRGQYEPLSVPSVSFDENLTIFGNEVLGSPPMRL